MLVYQHIRAKIESKHPYSSVTEFVPMTAIPDAQWRLRLRSPSAQPLLHLGIAALISILDSLRLQPWTKICNSSRGITAWGRTAPSVDNNLGLHTMIGRVSERQSIDLLSAVETSTTEACTEYTAR